MSSQKTSTSPLVKKEKKPVLSVKHYKSLAFIQWYNKYLLDNGIINDTALIDKTILSTDPSIQINFINSFQDFESTHINNFKTDLKSHIKTHKNTLKEFNKFKTTHIYKNPHLFLPPLQHTLPTLDSQHFLTNPFHPLYHHTLKTLWITNFSKDEKYTKKPKKEQKKDNNKKEQNTFVEETPEKESGPITTVEEKIDNANVNLQSVEESNTLIDTTILEWKGTKYLVDNNGVAFNFKTHEKITDNYETLLTT